MIKICFTAAEIVPFSKTGGLGDVSSALAGVLHRAGQDVRVFTPFYASVAAQEHPFRPVEGLRDIPLPFDGRRLTFSVVAAPLPGSAAPGGEDLQIYFLDCPELYDRPGIYTGSPDEHLRFAALSRGALACCRKLGWAPDVAHAHDWHAALQPLDLRTHFAGESVFADTKSLLTLHNISFQGTFPATVLADLGLETHAGLLPPDDLEAGGLNFLKAGILHADMLTTVSRTYAQEIQTPEYGFGLEDVLASRADRLVGIVNGIDDQVWNPALDPLIRRRYTAEDPSGKAENRRALLAELELDPDPEGPVLAAVSRLTHQKGFDYAFGPLAACLESEDVRLAALGTGEPGVEEAFRALERRFPGKVRFTCAYNEGLAHRHEAGADVFLMPSRFEPSGLNQMYSLKYGTIPLVRRTGGLADTVVPWNPETGRGTGFVFEHPDEQGFRWALGLALDTWRRPDEWRRLQANAMRQDFSWERQGLLYLDLYQQLAAGS